MRKKEKDPSKLEVLDEYEINGKLVDFIAKLQKIVDKHPGATISHEVDYTCCFYEGDHPSTKFIIRSK